MTAQNRLTLKGLFENGDKPQGTNFADLIDSPVSLSDSTAQAMTSTLQSPEFIGSVSANAVSISGVLTYTGKTTVAAISSGTTVLPATAAGMIKIVVASVTAAVPYFRVS